MFKLFQNFISSALIAALIIQPVLLHAQSIQIVGPDDGPRPHVDTSYNGTTVLNIDTPNAAGVSHDIYTEFTADDLILNNSATNVDTQLGGWIEGNPNFVSGQSADLWIGEVVGGNQTQLNGILEVGGQSMDVILANEFGITCNGCGFVNTDRATLTTGTPRFDANGGLSGFDIKQGTVTIGAQGLNPVERLSLADTSRVDVIARAAAIYGEMRGDQLNTVAGANIVDYDWSYDPQTGTVTGITEQDGVGSAPVLAVDVAALGGMYANAITMVATENGVGVRLNGQMASSTNIALRSDGQLTLGAPSGGRTPTIKAKEQVIIRNQAPLLLEGSIASENGNLIDIRTSSGALTFTGEADGGAITLESAGLVNITGAISASKALDITSFSSSVTVSDAAEISAATVHVEASSAATLNGKITASGALSVEAGAALSTGATSELSAQSIELEGRSAALAGKATAQDTLAAFARSGDLTNTGSLSGTDVVATAAVELHNNGKISANEHVQLTASQGLTTGGASETFGSDVTLSGASASLDGVIKADEALSITTTDSDLNVSGTLAAAQTRLSSAADIVNSGAIAGSSSVELSATDTLNSQAGSKISGGDVDLVGTAIKIGGDVVATAALDLTSGIGGIDNGGSLVGSQTALTSDAGILNRGTITGTDTASLSAATVLQTDQGSAVYGHSITMNGSGIVADGVIKADETLTLTAGSDGFEASGDLSAVSAQITSGAGADLDGVLDVTQDVTLVADGAHTSSTDAAMYGRNVTITAAEIDTAGNILADQNVTLTSTETAFENSGLVGGTDVVVSAATNLMNSGRIAAINDVDLSATETFSTTTGSEVSGLDLSINAAGVDSSGDIVATGTLTIEAGATGLNNSGTIIGASSTLMSEAQLANSGTVTGSTSLSLDAETTLETGEQSALYGTDIDIDGTTVSLDGVVAATQDVTVTAGAGGATMDGDISGRSLSLTSAENVTHNGIIDAAQNASVTATGSYVSSADAALYGDKIALDAASITNAGDIFADDTTNVTSQSGDVTNTGLIASAKTTVTSASNLTNGGTLGGSTSLVLDAQNTLTTQSGSETSGGALTLEAIKADISGTVAAQSTLEITAGTGGITNAGDIIGDTTRLTSDAGLSNSGSITGRTSASLSMADDFTLGSDFAVYGASIEVSANKITAEGVFSADEALTLNAGAGGLSNSGTLSAQDVTLTSQSSIENTGVVSAGDQLVVDAATSLTNVATLISGNELAIYADQIINNGGVIWANDSITLAASDTLEHASLVQNTNGRIEAFQGDLIIRADEVANLGTAPTIGASEIIKWLEQGSSEATDPVAELSKLIDPIYLDADGNILPEYSAEYAALWEDVMSGGDVLSTSAQSILKDGVTTPSGTALKSDFAGLWEDLETKANAEGISDPTTFVKDMVSSDIFDETGAVLPEYADAYAALWVTLLSGGTTVTDEVKAILDPSVLVVESTEIDPETEEEIVTYSNTLVSDNTDVWTAISASSGASYDIVKILYQDRFNDDGVLAEMVAGGTIDIKATEVRNIFGNISAGDDLFITADSVTNQAMGASQVLLEVHKKPGCFICHEGEVDFYDTFGGRIEAVGNIAISGSVTNVTLNSSELSIQDVMDEMNAYIEEQQAAGDKDLVGVPLVAGNNFHLEEHREDDYTAPVEGNGTDIRDVTAVDTGSQTVVDKGEGTPNVALIDLATVAVASALTGSGTPTVTTTDVTTVETVEAVTGSGTPTITPIDPGSYSSSVEVVTSVTPTLEPTARVDSLLSIGLNTLSETNPEFTDYANYITSNYMMDVDRLQNRDNLINNTSEALLAALNSSTVKAQVGPLDYLNNPVQVPSVDGSGLQTIYPSQTRFELSGTGALISGTNVAISGDAIDNSGTILASVDASITANSITGSGGSITADTGKVALTALGRIELEDVKIDGGQVDIIAGQDFVGKGVSISSQTDTSIYATTGVTLTSLEREYEINRSRTVINPFTGETKEVDKSTLKATDQLTSSLTTGGDLSIVTSGDLVLAGVQGEIGENTTLSASGDLIFGEPYIDPETEELRYKAPTSSAQFNSGDAKNGTDIASVTSHVTSFYTGGDFTANAGGKAVLVGTQIDAGGTLQLAAVEDVVLTAAQDLYSSSTRKSKSSWGGLKKSSSSHDITQVTNEGVRIAASGNVDVIAQSGDLVTAGTTFVSNNGDVNLSAIEGEIYAGTYTDVFQEQKKKSSSFLFGLINSSSQLNTTDKFKTGTAALAALDLSLVSGADTTLVGANLSAGQTLNINAGGNLNVQAAIDSQRSEFFSTNSGMVTTTTITEKSFVETALLTQFLSGQGMRFDIGGETNLTIYEQAGVDAPTLEDLYPEELLALDGLNLLTQDLANEYFYDKQTSISPAFKMLVSIALAPYTAGFGTALGFSGAAATAATAFANNFLMGSLDGIVSGDFDLGAIIGDAFKSAATAGITAGLSEALLGGAEQFDEFGEIMKDAEGAPILTKGPLTDFIQDLPTDSVLGFGNGNLSLQNIMSGTLNGAISSGVSSLVYGTDFMDGFSNSVLNTVVNLTLADVQFEIGELGVVRDENGDIISTNKEWEGSFQHAILHGLAGCAAGEAIGASCAAGAVGGIAQSIYAGTLNEDMTQEQRADAARKAEMLGALVGYIMSGGDPANVSTASAIAASGLKNNYLSHDQISQLQQELSNCTTDQGSDFAACRAEVLAKYVEISEDQNAQLAACKTDTCRAEHLARIQVAEGLFESVVFNLMTSQEYNGVQLKNLQYKESDKIDATPELTAAFNTALRTETTKTFCTPGDVNSCDMSVKAKLESYGVLTQDEQDTLNGERLEKVAKMERQARAELAKTVCDASMNAAQCSKAVGDKIESERKLNNRIVGAIDLVFGAAEIAGAVYMCPASGGTACATASVVVGAHGIDTAQAGLEQLITGEEALPYGVQLMMTLTGLDKTQASLAYDLMTLGFELNAVRALAKQGPEALIKQHDQALSGQRASDFVFEASNRLPDFQYGTVNGKYDAVNPGPLDDGLAGTFSGGKYSEVVLDKDVVLHRAGTGDTPLGQFFTQNSPDSVLKTRIDSAILPEWPGGAKSPIDSSFDVKIPAGTKVYVGEVSSQGGIYVGGTQQIVVPKPWLIDGVEVVGSKPLQ